VHAGDPDARVGATGRHGVCHISPVEPGTGVPLPAKPGGATQPASGASGDGTEWVVYLVPGTEAALPLDARDIPYEGRMAGARTTPTGPAAPGVSGKGATSAGGGAGRPG